MKIVAIVVTYNRLLLLEECINSLLNQSYKTVDILIVDNNSTDGTKEYITQLTKEHNDKIKALHLTKNIGAQAVFMKESKKH